MTYKDTDKQREAKCSNCGKEVPQTDGKRPRLYCDDACRKRMKRRTAHKLNQMADVINGQIINGHPITDKPEATASPSVDECRTDGTKLSTSDSNPGQGVSNPCKYCGKQLEFAILECCSDCALKQPTKVSPAQDGHILASRPALEFSGKMTAFESERYKSASELKPGKYNPVSKPGDADWDNINTAQWKAERSRC